MLDAVFTTASLTGRHWRWRDANDRTGLAIAQAHALPEIVGRLLAARGLTAADAADHLAPTLRRFLPDPSILLDMDAGAARLADAVRAGETVGIFGDYDVDGACSAALLATGLRALGCRVLTHIPDRIAEGYGPGTQAIARMIEAGATLVVCVDCGTAAGDILAPLAARADILVLDHHKSENVPAGIVGTVNPNRPDDTSGLGQLCAAGIVFLTLVATLRALRRTRHFAHTPEPDLLGLLDVVALATICDVVPLTGLNRALVAQGLRVMARRRRPGLAALLDVAAIRTAPTAFSCGYAIGPRINAGGRIGDPGLGLALLLTEDAGEAAAIAATLDATNRERRTVEASILEPALDDAARQLAAGHPTIVLEGAWHPGIVGIVAGRLKQRFNRPVCVGARGADLTKGSGRSIPGIDLGSAIIAARQSGLLATGGGHAMAAGYGHAPGDAPRLHAFLDERLAAAGHAPAQPELVIDGTISVPGATVELARHVEALAPFGAGNEEPVFVLSGARIVRADRLGAEGNTLRCILQGEAGQGRLKSILFRANDSALAAHLSQPGGPPLNLAGQLRAERWNDTETATFAIEDASNA
jgi:single-stranded-DNA-specific exonuclease